ncbi:MAG: hypothetical protein GY866_21955 [Proteobacteria bacterium]|nr:hypothetical protein [Pseudomonadota bacterium]
MAIDERFSKPGGGMVWDRFRLAEVVPALLPGGSGRLTGIWKIHDPIDKKLETQDNQTTSLEKKALVGTAVGLYLVTRIGVFITINERIHEYNEYMKIRLELVEGAEAGVSRLRAGLEASF